tara:strand:+ start:246 stop:1085 length:840 start_codon:yes stop_codon:yes gene_type:complete
MILHEVIIRGGLGNQLFGLFYAYKFSQKPKNKVSLNILNYAFIKREDRVFLLNKLFPCILDEFEINSRNSFYNYLLFYYSKIFEKLFVRSISGRIPGDNPFYINYWPNKYLHSGYFQKIEESEMDCKSLELFKRKFTPFIKNKTINYLAIHIRRGDYLTKKHSIHGVISEKYLYEESKKQIANYDFDGITIFTDSPEFINLDIFKSLHKNIKIDEGGNTLDVFKRMANHKGLIASNSSFSLWAGILGDIDLFSLPYYWMKNVESSLLGLDNIPRYKCLL